MNLEEIRSQIIEYANRKNLFSAAPTSAQVDRAIIDAAIAAAITEITTLYEFRVTEATDRQQLMKDIADYNLPADYLSMRYVVVEDSNGNVIGKLDYQPPETFDMIRTETGTSQIGLNLIYAVLGCEAVGIYTIDGDKIRLKPSPAGDALRLTQKYHKSLPDLKEDGEKNYFSEKYPMFCIFGGLCNIVTMLQIRSDNSAVGEIRQMHDRWIDIITARESLSKSREILPIPLGFAKVSYSG